jgi:hypothetical protein
MVGQLVSIKENTQIGMNKMAATINIIVEGDDHSADTVVLGSS